MAFHFLTGSYRGNGNDLGLVCRFERGRVQRSYRLSGVGPLALDKICDKRGIYGRLPSKRCNYGHPDRRHAIQHVRSEELCRRRAPHRRPLWAGSLCSASRVPSPSSCSGLAILSTTATSTHPTHVRSTAKVFPKSRAPCSCFLVLKEPMSGRICAPLSASTVPASIDLVVQPTRRATSSRVTLPIDCRPNSCSL
jgi:hypothetical protein